jgi:glycosyltransferase involved in cell wall biosynthesis
MTLRVTVLLAVHDGEPYVRQCVESILGQSFEDFELLVVDDASTDGTAAIVESFGDPRVRVLRNDENVGQVPSLNRGLREARGEYVARIDSDDWCRPTRLERQVAVLDHEPRVALVGSWLDVVDEHDRPVAELRERMDDLVQFVYQTLIMRVYVTHPAAMYRRDAVLGLGGYDESTGPSEDKDLWRRLLLTGCDARIVPEPLLVYRLHERQLSQVHADRQRWIDGESQDRFLAKLAPDEDVRPLRLLLSGDDGVWSHEITQALPVLAHVLRALRSKLPLGETEVARLDELVGERLVAVAAARPWRADARAVVHAGLAKLSGSERTSALARGAVAPVRAGARRAARAVVRTPLLTPVRGHVRRSRLARRLYGKVAGGR